MMEDVRQMSESGQDFETYRDSRPPLDEKQQGGDQFIINTRDDAILAYDATM